MENTQDIEKLHKVVQEAVIQAVSRLCLAPTGESIFPLRTARELSQAFRVEPCTVRSWHKKGELRGHYQVLSGRSCRLVFTNRDVMEFFNRNFPSEEDLFDHPNSPRTSKARLIEKMFRMNRLYARTRQKAIKDNGNRT